ncbi:MAG: photosynthesis system II assembly factor Ycf48 [Pseudanabaenaceae cyanobacterium]
MARWMERLTKTVLVAVLGLALWGLGNVPVWAAGTWQRVPLDTQATLLDIDLVGDRGWLVGTGGTLLTTTDGGKTWRLQTLDLRDANYRFVSVSFAGDEGWIVGQPSLLLRTTDGGQSWSRIGLSSQLPGSPQLVKALGPQTAEMSTDVGAIYRTQDGGLTWQALVRDAVGNSRNLYRSEDGRYLAVSTTGSFYSTWEPGQPTWQGHNRNSSRKVQNMGYAPNGRVWMLNRGGQIQFSKPNSLDEWEKPQFPRAASGFGLLDLAFQDDNNVWVTGGSSRLLHSADGGKTWERDASAANLGTNLYRIRFFGPERGFILGADGVLLRYQPA